MCEIELYQTQTGRCPVMEFLEQAPKAAADKVAKVLDAVRQMERVPEQYLKKLSGTRGLWEVRAQHGGNAYRLLGFWSGRRLVVLLSGFVKKTEEVPAREIALAQQRRRDYLERNQRDG
jgi:phage-related protein